MKNNIKKLIPSFILSFVTSFMFFLYEPLIMYSSSINDFWFDLDLMVKPNLLASVICFFAIFIFLFIFYLLDYVIWKKTKLYDIVLIIGYISFLVCYIHGNFFAASLPSLDGHIIDWSLYKKEYLFSLIIILIFISALIVLLIKYKKQNVIKYGKYLICIIFCMLLVSYVSILLTNKEIYTTKLDYSQTNNNLDELSDNRNFIIFLIDAVDSVDFENEMKKAPEYYNILQDFTYFPDTMSAYPFTRDSIPFILSGIWNENKTDFNTYSTNALNNSYLIDNLEKNKYEINLYDNEIIWNSKKAKKIANFKELSRNINKKSFIMQEMKFDLYKYLPYFLKKYSRIDTMNFDKAKLTDEYTEFDWHDKTFYNYINTNPRTYTNNKIFKFIHLEGAHTPFDIDKNLNEISNGNYLKKVEASMTLVKQYINYLKSNNAYDNSIIILMADHGCNYGEVDGRQNPILFIKGINENHNKMIKSDIPVSYEDLNSAYDDLLAGKKSKELFNNIPQQRTRRYLWYEFTKEDHMVEYEQTGKAWQEDTMHKTGREFNR
jgi:hypothetical protein